MFLSIRKEVLSTTKHMLQPANIEFNVEFAFKRSELKVTWHE